MGLCKFSSILIWKCGRAMGKSVTFRLLTAESLLQSHLVHFGFVVDKVALPSSTSVYRCPVNTPSLRAHSFIHQVSV
jgi:hypothetical protein